MHQRLMDIIPELNDDTVTKTVEIPKSWHDILNANDLTIASTICIYHVITLSQVSDSLSKRVVIYRAQEMNMLPDFADLYHKAI